MRRSQVWSIALKDLADFRTSKYAFYSLAVPPILFGTVLPIFYLIPFQAEIGEGPRDLDLAGVSPFAGNASGRVLDHVAIDGGTVADAKLNASRLENATLRRSFIEGSLLVNVTLIDCFVVGSNLAGNTTVQATVLVETVFVDRENPEEALIAAVFFNLLLLMLMIIPAMVPTVLASYSLVGEKASGSLEPLLATPSSDGEILAGKISAIILPTLAVCWLGGALAVTVVSLVGGQLLERHPIPFDAFLAAALLFVPAFAMLSILANVVISSRVSDVRAAQQMGGFVVLPVVILFIGSVTGGGTLGVAWIAGSSVLIVAVDALFAVLCLRLFRREEILVRWK
jgi:ABC-2 type transport system permease protein